MSKSKQYKSTIRSLKLKARQSDFDAMMQLHEYYAKGQYVEQDQTIADRYLADALAIFGQQDIRISSMAVSAFRALSDFELLELDDRLNVFMGINGAGKTSILDALGMCLSRLRIRIVSDGGTGDSIDEMDINLDEQTAVIKAHLQLNQHIKADVMLTTSREKTASPLKNHVVEMTKLGQAYRQANSVDKNYNLPLLAYYTVRRSLDLNIKDVKAFDEVEPIIQFDKFAAYYNSLDGRADFKAFFRWFKRIDDIDNHRQVSQRQVNSGANNTVDWGFVNKLKQMADSDMIAKTLLTKIMDDLSEEDQQQASAGAVDVKAIKGHLNRVISAFMPGYGNLTIHVEPHLKLTINKNGKELNVLQLSQGEKSLLALMLDIARRLILLNPSREDPLEGHGIVLIDEFDLHVHPQWQRNIIKSLPKIFPNCQFFISTHSPQIIGEVKPQQLYALMQDEKGKISCVRPEQSYGLSSNEILNGLMNPQEVSLSRTAAVERQLIEIFDLIDEKALDEAKLKIGRLEQELNGEIPELVAAKFDIDIDGWDD